LIFFNIGSWFNKLAHKCNCNIPNLNLKQTKNVFGLVENVFGYSVAPLVNTNLFGCERNNNFSLPL
jgi:hypothetical protein